MTAFEKLEAASPDVRRAALELLDEISAPMDARSIDRALMHAGFTRGKAREITKVLKHLPIIAIGQPK